MSDIGRRGEDGVYRRDDQIPQWLFVLFVGLAIAVAAWIAFFADCSSIGWLPVKDMPGRCLMPVQR